MKPLLSILLIYSIGFTQELTVDGNLNVTGNIQNQTIDSLQQVIAGLQSQITALQNSNSWKTRSFELNNVSINFAEENPTQFTIEDITGYNLDYAALQIVDIEPLENIEQAIQVQGKIDFISNGGYNTHNESFYISTIEGQEFIRFPDQFTYNNDYIEHLEFSMSGYSLGVPPFLVNITFLVTAQFPDSTAPTYQAPVPPQNSRTAP